MVGQTTNGKSGLEQAAIILESGVSGHPAGWATGQIVMKLSDNPGQIVLSRSRHNVKWSIDFARPRVETLLLAGSATRFGEPTGYRNTP